MKLLVGLILVATAAAQLTSDTGSCQLLCTSQSNSLPNLLPPNNNYIFGQPNQVQSFLSPFQNPGVCGCSSVCLETFTCCFDYLTYFQGQGQVQYLQSPQYFTQYFQQPQPVYVQQLQQPQPVYIQQPVYVQ